jgi:Domain of unknown function (DUF1877)
MAGRGVHFAIDDNVLSDLFAQPMLERADFVSNFIEENWDANFATETDKAWALIHSALQRSDPETDWLQRSTDEPSSWAILGREYINTTDGFLIGLIRASDVAAVVGHLEAVEASDIVAQLKVNVEHFGCVNIDDEDLEYAGQWYPGLKVFFARAAEAKRHVIFTTDF